MATTMTRGELDAWQKYLLGKSCPNHPNSIIKKGKYGLWCGNKNDYGSWCDGGWADDEWLDNYRKQQITK